MPAPVRLEGFDPRGCQVATPIHQSLAAGRHAVAWDGRDLPSGVYFVRLTADGSTRTARVARLK